MTSSTDKKLTETHSTQPRYLIEASGISHQFAGTQVLNDISLKIAPKEIITLIGPNGAGKSTLLKILLGLLTPSQGRVKRAANLRVGFMPQKIQVDATLPMTVERFLQLGISNPQNDFSVFNPFYLLKRLLPSKKAAQKQKVLHHNTTLEKITAELNIQGLLKSPVQKVSGGEMQRILLARALMREPQLLVLDEPVQGVDIQGQTELYDYINQIRQTYGCSIVMVSHDLHIVMRHTDHVLCINQHLCCHGHPQSVSQHAEFKALFGDFSESIAFYEHHHDPDSCEHTHGEHSHGEHIDGAHTHEKPKPAERDSIETSPSPEHVLEHSLEQTTKPSQVKQGESS